MRRMLIASVAALAALVLAATVMVGAAGGAGGRAAATSDAALFAVLTGRAEVGGGDRDGRGAAYVFVTSSRICYGLAVNGIDRPAAAHIHRGRAGTNGPIVLPLRTPSAGNNGTSSACTAGSATLRNQLKRSPSAFYVNVHTRAFPDGAVRGQLRK